MFSLANLFLLIPQIPRWPTSSLLILLPVHSFLPFVHGLSLPLFSESDMMIVTFGKAKNFLLSCEEVWTKICVFSFLPIFLYVPTPLISFLGVYPLFLRRRTWYFSCNLSVVWIYSCYCCRNQRCLLQLKKNREGWNRNRQGCILDEFERPKRRSCYHRKV